MSTWFETKVRYTKAQEDGSEKPVTEAALLMPDTLNSPDT